MPVHDWTRVQAGASFTRSTTNGSTEISRALNRGILPPQCSAAAGAGGGQGFGPDVLTLEMRPDESGPTRGPHLRAAGLRFRS